VLKPVRRERLLHALEHAAHITRMRLAELTRQNQQLGGRQNIPVTLSGKIRLVPAASVIAFHAEQKYVQMLHEVDGRVRESLIDEALKALEEEFSDSFVRIHRSALVRLDAITGLDRDDAGQYTVALRGVPEPLPVSRRHAPQLREMLRS
jgi:two-component system response regulator AlgR